MDFLNQIAGAVKASQQQGQQQQDQSNQGQYQGGEQQQQQQQPFQAQGQEQGQEQLKHKEGGPSISLPPQLLQIINKYVDGFAPGISQGIAQEIQAFESSTLGSLEQHVKDVIKGIFHGDKDEDFQSSNNIAEFKAARTGENQSANMPQYNYPDTNSVDSRDGSGGANLPGYGTRGLPFAGGPSADAAPAQVDPEAPQRNKNIFASALGAVKDFADKAEDTVQEGVEHQMKNMANKVSEIAGDIDQKVEEIFPDIKAEVQKVLQQLHTGLAEKMAHAATTCLKDFLGGAVRLEELGEEAIKGFQQLFSGFGGGDERDTNDGNVGHGATGLLSNKLSGGLYVVRRGARVDFRDFLSKIEESLFNNLPDCLKGPLSKIFGGNPFDSDAQAGADQSQEHGGLLSGIQNKLKAIIDRIQQSLRDRVLEIVSGGHRRLEDAAWGNVQESIVGKVQKIAPDVQVKLQDDPRSTEY